METRKAEPEDAQSILSMHSASIRELCKTHYSPEQIIEWVEGLRCERYVQAMELFEFLVTEDENQIVGLCVLDLSGELNALYVAPGATRRGIGSALLSRAEELARKSCLSRLTLTSTLNALSFYESHGWVRLEESVHRLPGGAELPGVRMMKALTSQAEGA